MSDGRGVTRIPSALGSLGRTPRACCMDLSRSLDPPHILVVSLRTSHWSSLSLGFPR